jgi:hypothetical protein
MRQEYPGTSHVLRCVFLERGSILLIRSAKINGLSYQEGTVRG